MNISEEDIIHVKSWMQLGYPNYEVDYLEPDKIPESGIIYCNIEHIGDFFEKCKKTDNEYVVISGFSDYGFAIQEQHPVWYDMYKWLGHVKSYLSPDLEYQDLVVPSRREKEKTDISHTYSVKCDSYTLYTVEDIPKNVKTWFLANPMCMHEKIVGIPFGISDNVDKSIFNKIQHNKMSDKKKYCYLNWSDYTSDRADIRKFFKNKQHNWLTIQEQPKPQIEFYQDISEHAFILCPQGNGVDTYRFLETIYCGSIPIVQANVLANYLDGLPMVAVQNMKDLDFSILRRILSEVAQQTTESLIKTPKHKLSYWKELITEAGNGISTIN